MAMAIGVDRELGAPEPAVQRHVDRRQLVGILGTLTASLTFSAGLTPPDGLWSDARIRGDVFVASLAVVLLLFLSKNPVSSNQRIKLYALQVALTLGLLSLIGSYVAVSSLSFVTSICVSALAAALVIYIAIKIQARLCKPVAVEISLSSVQESRQRRRMSSFIPKRPRKNKKYLLKVEQKNHQEQNIISGQGTGDAYQILKESRMHMLLLGTLWASVTYEAALNGIWQGEAHNASGEHRTLHNKRHLVFFSYNASALVVSLAIVFILIMSSVFRTQGIKYYFVLQAVVTLDLFCLIGAYVAVTLDWFCLIGAYVAVRLDSFCLIGAYVVGGIWQLLRPVNFTMLVVLVFISVVILLQAFLSWAIWRQALREKMEQCLPDSLKKWFGISTDGHAEEEEEEEMDDEEEDEGGVAMELKLEHWRKLLLMLAILAAILAYHAILSPPPGNLANYRRLAFSYCEAIVFIASLSIIAMLANMKLPAARGIRWHAMRVCVILDVIGLTGAFAARGYWKISTTDVLILALAVLLCITFHVALSIHGTPRGLVQSLLSKLGSPPVIAVQDPFQDDGAQHDFEFGITGGTNEEPLGVEIASPILGGALTLYVAIPVISIISVPMKLLVGIMIASIGVGLWRRSLARLLVPLARALQRRQGTTSPTGSSSTPAEHGLCKLIHTLCSETWMWIIILVMWVPSLRPNIKLKLKISKILAVLSVLVADGTPTPNTTTATAASTTTTVTMDTPNTATSTVVGTPITAAASPTSMGGGVQTLVEPRPRRNRRANSWVFGPDWVN